MAITSRPWKRGHVFVLIEDTQWVPETSAAKCSVAHNSEVTQHSRRPIFINSAGAPTTVCRLQPSFQIEPARNLKHSNRTDTAHQASYPPPPDQTTRHSAIAASKHRHQTRLPTCCIHHRRSRIRNKRVRPIDADSLRHLRRCRQLQPSIPHLGKPAKTALENAAPNHRRPNTVQPPSQPSKPPVHRQADRRLFQSTQLKTYAAEKENAGALRRAAKNRASSARGSKNG